MHAEQHWSLDDCTPFFDENTSEQELQKLLEQLSPDTIINWAWDKKRFPIDVLVEASIVRGDQRFLSEMKGRLYLDLEPEQKQKVLAEILTHQINELDDTFLQNLYEPLTARCILNVLTDDDFYEEMHSISGAGIGQSRYNILIKTCVALLSKIEDELTELKIDEVEKIFDLLSFKGINKNPIEGVLFACFFKYVLEWKVEGEFLEMSVKDLLSSEPISSAFGKPPADYRFISFLESREKLALSQSEQERLEEVGQNVSGDKFVQKGKQELEVTGESCHEEEMDKKIISMFLGKEPKLINQPVKVSVFNL